MEKHLKYVLAAFLAIALLAFIAESFAPQPGKSANSSPTPSSQIIVANTSQNLIPAQKPSNTVTQAGTGGLDAVFTFDADPVGQLPNGFTSARTGPGSDGVWEVKEDSRAPSGKNVLAQTKADSTSGRFPIAVATKNKYADLSLSVKFKPVSGTVDQAGGLVFRYTDANNYYLVRANALENNFRLYHVVDGNRVQFSGKSVNVTANVWHTMDVVMAGNHIQASFDGNPLIDATDKTFTEAGFVGFWTKADSITYFDDLEVKDLGTLPSDSGVLIQEIIGGPGDKATDTEVPKVKNLSELNNSKITLVDALKQTEAKYSPAIEAKFETGDDKKLSLSVYPVGNGINTDAARNVLQELAGDPTVPIWSPTLVNFTDEEHWKGAARDLTVVQTAGLTLREAVEKVNQKRPGFVYWALPTIRDSKPGYGVYTQSNDGASHYFFVGKTRDVNATARLQEIPGGPGKTATDSEVPKLANVTDVRKSKINLVDALKQVEAKYSPAIEAKFETGDDGNLSLSIYPVGNKIDTDAARNVFQELAGNPVTSPWNPTLANFTDEEHLKGSARDLTLVQTAGLTLREAVEAVGQKMPGFVYWALPTIRDGNPGYGVYTLDNENKSRYFFVDMEEK